MIPGTTTPTFVRRDFPEREVVLGGIAVTFEGFREKWLGIMEAPNTHFRSFPVSVMYNFLTEIP